MFYEYFVTVESEQGSQLYAKCPFHNDTNASLTINTETLEWYCHGCAIGGTPVEFLVQYFGVGKKVASKAYSQYEQRGSLPFPSFDEIEQYHKNLMDRPNEVALLGASGISEEVLKQFKIGFNPADVRIQIPIKTVTENYCNIRKYLPEHRRLGETNVMKVLNQKNCGESRLFPIKEAIIDTPDSECIVIVEGEKDMLAARSQGINAITGTGGSAVPRNDLNLLKNRTVYVMTDNDTAGDKIAADYLKYLGHICKQVKRIKLPQKDYCEFYQDKGPADIFEYVVLDTEELMDSAEDMALIESESVEKLNTWALLENMSVVGTDPKIYTIPTKIAPVCTNDACQSTCFAHPSMSARLMPTEVDPRQLVLFIDSSDYVQDKFIQEEYGCKHMRAEIVESTNAQKIMFQEAAAFMEGMDESSTDNRYGIYLFDESRLAPTHKFNFEACRVADPRNQQNYYVIRKAESITTHEVSDEDMQEALNYFKSVAAQCTTFEEIINIHYKSWMPLLNIEGRPDLFAALMLTYLSVTEIQWRGGRLKGWLDTMVIGDTRTGKSQMAQRLTKQLSMGSYINGENARATGVIGGVQRMGDSWIITWGAIPMNDRGLLVVDEASGLSIDDIKDLSATRSSGAVTINKIAKGEARARTRLVWLSNPRSGRNLEEFYWRGFGAFTEFIPVAEDQARYDIVLTAAREDVPELEGYKDDGARPPVEFWRTLIHLAWSISSDAIRYSDEVAQHIAIVARELGKTYGGGTLVVEVAVHEKLIRLSCAIAMLMGNITSAKFLGITKQHVDFAKSFLVSTYEKPSMDYANYIREYTRVQRDKTGNINFVRGLFAAHPALKMLLSSNVFRGNQVREILGTSTDEASSIISQLVQKGLLKLTGSGAYTPDKLLIDITKQMDGGR